MSIDWLLDLERDIENGRDIFACPGPGRNQWVIGRSIDELRKVAKRTADTTKLPTSIVRVVHKNEAVSGDLFLVPTSIGEPGTRGEPQIQWKTIETKEAAEMMRDVRKGPAPYFAMQVQETVEATAS